MERKTAMYSMTGDDQTEMIKHSNKDLFLLTAESTKTGYSLNPLDLRCIRT